MESHIKSQKISIVSAYNVRSGGGVTLLKMLLSKARSSPKTFLFLVSSDLTIDQSEFPNIQFQFFGTSFKERYKAERILKRFSKNAASVLCFGSVPPLFKSQSQRVFVYVQNLYVVSKCHWLSKTSLRTIVRSTIEKIWFILRKNKNYTYLVQTKIAQSEARRSLGEDYRVEICPFFNQDELITEEIDEELEYLYVSSTEPHKMHNNLIKAWILLKEMGYLPSLTLITGANENSALLLKLKEVIEHESLNVKIINSCPRQKTLGYIKKSKALVFPSIMESFGLPLIEASILGTRIISSDLPYVYEVCTPVAVFDPRDPSSIAKVIANDIKTYNSRFEVDERKYPSADQVINLITAN